MTVKDELLALSKKRAKLTTGYVVDWARGNPKSALHATLEWDDKVAGEKYRQWQVRHLIAIYVFDDAGDRQLVSLSIDRVEGGYRALDEISNAPDLMAVMLSDAENELIRVRKTYGRVKELVSIWSAIDRVAAKKKGGKSRAA